MIMNEPFTKVRASGATEAALPVPVSSATQLCARLHIMHSAQHRERSAIIIIFFQAEHIHDGWLNWPDLLQRAHVEEKNLFAL
jgi:hypothetical protein